MLLSIRFNVTASVSKASVSQSVHRGKQFAKAYLTDTTQQYDMTRISNISTIRDLNYVYRIKIKYSLSSVYNYYCKIVVV